MSFNKLTIICLFLIMFSPGFILGEEIDLEESEVKETTKTVHQSAEPNSLNPNSIELKGGIYYNNDIVSPLASILYQRDLNQNWALGLAITGINLANSQKNEDVGSLNFFGNSNFKARLVPIDFVIAYNFMEGSSFRPFIRGYLGGAIFSASYEGRGGMERKREERFFHGGLGLGFRYFISDNFYAVTEMNANYFDNEFLKKDNTHLYGQVGLGVSF
ncbi:hypothetical protein [Leptospira sp. GIMC2001]|uniref:hypothetical protein n=1 Tax=Leptospira sp. GIMC2001 TaxID=1513297 RepID=UPI0023498972|nr:hypothetical protein [Leptospira sp. GIMC2001]WCL49640.1 hypothetical protein O4O04_02140 [Leptospira sp. GIMC2001]